MLCHHETLGLGCWGWDCHLWAVSCTTGPRQWWDQMKYELDRHSAGGGEGTEESA